MFKEVIQQKVNKNNREDLFSTILFMVMLALLAIMVLLNI